MHCIHTDKDIVKLHVRSGNCIILVFLASSAGAQFQWELLQRGLKIHRVGKMRFSTEISISFNLAHPVYAYATLQRHGR